MDAFAIRPTRAHRRMALYRLGQARRRGAIDDAEYKLRRQLARRAETLADLQALLEDFATDYEQGRDHWRYGRWRRPVREGHELEIQRFIGISLVVIALVVVFAVVYGVIAVVDRVN
ncbi:hypothetical protein GCM10009853_042480 [Glycomyces scopariae]|uniref:DUF1707 domain-containing protein n=1 Tax=Glycomyces sambucus TaxID=380244 RepID=A0A1G9E0Q8_9ACTN|nr:DUF1707 domain-containing protein [Glycomyces sambucus]SDK69668.1 hypothetical protein SAMN05216298_1221 [Glycomyces sambucus]